MTEQSHICEICGGAKDLILPKLKTSRGMPVTSVIPPELRTSRVCLGHPKGTPKHDGKLDSHVDGDFDGEVRLDGRHVRLECFGSQVVLEAKQAISLLSWLEQNRAELTALAEQEQ